MFPSDRCLMDDSACVDVYSIPFFRFLSLLSLCLVFCLLRWDRALGRGISLSVYAEALLHSCIFPHSLFVSLTYYPWSRSTRKSVLPETPCLPSSLVIARLYPRSLANTFLFSSLFPKAMASESSQPQRDHKKKSTFTLCNSSHQPNPNTVSLGAPLVQPYLVAYNLLSAAGWSLVLYRTLAHLFGAPQQTQLHDSFLTGSTAPPFVWVPSLLPAHLAPLYTRACTTYAAVGTVTARVQTAAVLEVLHVILGLVRSPLPTTTVQVASRLFSVWAIAARFPSVRPIPVPSQLDSPPPPPLRRSAARSTRPWSSPGHSRRSSVTCSTPRRCSLTGAHPHS